MKLRDLGVWEMEKVIGGDGWEFGFSCGVNFPGGFGCQIGVGYSVSITGASQEAQIRNHNNSQWEWGNAIRKSDDGKEFWSTNVAPSGNVEGYR
ncbi:MAG: hypothetical protein N2318_05135 [Meiothermus sp.]|nr:hypothetical protein [Meiothermus sp.]